MNKDLQNKLYTSYPKIFNINELDPRQPFPMFGIETDNGWFFIIDKLCSCIQRYIDNNDHLNITQVVATQVKEKFGVLHFYFNGGNQLIEGMVWLAEHISATTCEHCGTTEDVTQNADGWISTLCDKCRDKTNE